VHGGKQRYPSNYGTNQQCTITVAAHTQVTLSVTAFNVEAQATCDWDYLTVNGVKYCGTTGPAGVQVAARATITFTSDALQTRTGFEVCGASLLPTCSNLERSVAPVDAERYRRGSTLSTLPPAHDRLTFWERRFVSRSGAFVIHRAAAESATTVASSSQSATPFTSAPVA
jgi:hypothetical protein